MAETRDPRRTGGADAMTTTELVRQYRATTIGRATWPMRERERELAKEAGKAPAALKIKPAPAADDSPWSQASNGGKRMLVMETCLSLHNAGKRWQCKDVAESIGAPLSSVKSHMRELRLAGLIPYKRGPYGRRA